MAVVEMLETNCVIDQESIMGVNVICVNGNTTEECSNNENSFLLLEIDRGTSSPQIHNILGNNFQHANNC